ncbi:Beta-barrel assembly-enhancing protease [subsurface metagenome]
MDNIEKLFDLFTRESNLNKIIDDYKKKLSTNPNSIELLTRLAEVYNLKGQYKKSIELCEKVLKINPKYKPALNNLFFAFDRCEDYQQALKILKSYTENFSFKKIKELQRLTDSLELKMLVKENKRNPVLEGYLPLNYPSEVMDINFSTSFQFSKIGWSVRRSDVLKHVLEKYPQDIDLWNALGLSYIFSDKYDDAKTAIDKALQIDRNNDMTHYLLGSLYLKIKNYKEAEKEFIAIIGQSLGPLNLTNPLIPAEISNGDFREEGFLHMQIWAKLGLIYNEIGEYEKALVACKKSLMLVNHVKRSIATLLSRSPRDPIRTLIFKNLGVAYYALDDNKRALKALRKALKIDPENVEVLEYLGEMYFEMKKFKQATEIFQQIIIIKPEDYLAWHLLSKSYYKSNKISLAKEANSRCLTLNPNFKPALELRNNLS